jgi:hypothetical protein
MSLNKKAKTLEQWLYGSQCTSLNEVMVRLEDAQQEIDRLKQKLKELVDDFYSGYPVTRLFLRLQELLKEEKEAKPT